MNLVLNGDNLYNEEIPLPTKSTTQNLIKDSEIVSYSNNTINNNIHPNPYKSQQVKYKSNNSRRYGLQKIMIIIYK